MTILHVFGSPEQKNLFIEIVSQLDPNIEVDHVSKEWQILLSLRKNPPLKLPALIVLDDPPFGQNLDTLVDHIRKQASCGDIPIILFVPEYDPILTSLIQRKNVFVFPKPGLPSEYKYLLRRILSPPKHPTATSPS